MFCVHECSEQVLQADAIRVKVGFPLSPNTRSAGAIAAYYSLVRIDKDKFFENILSSELVYHLAIDTRLLNYVCCTELVTSTRSGRCLESAGIWSRGKCIHPWLTHISTHLRMKYLIIVLLSVLMLTVSQIVFPAGILRPPFFSQYWLVKLFSNSSFI